MTLLKKTVPFLEIHPTARCNLECRWCTYAGSDRSQQLRLADLACVSELTPEEVLIAGGGEPTLYDDAGRGFDQFVRCLRAAAPSARLRLITNGLVIPPGSWRQEVDEISISLDAADAGTYAECKGVDAFDAVLGNIEAYLTGPGAPHVRVTYLYDHSRLDGAISLAERLWRIQCSVVEANQSAKKDASQLTFKVLPLADDSSPDRPYAKAELSDADKQRWFAQMKGLRQQDALWRFIRCHTNLTTKPLEQLAVPPARRCWCASNYLLLGADRNFHACFRMCARCPQRNLGPVDQGGDALLRAREAYLLAPPEDCRRGCRPGGTFYGIRSADRFIEKFRADALAQWDAIVNTELAAHVERDGIEKAMADSDPSPARGIVWFASQVRYKKAGRPRCRARSPSAPPASAGLMVQYNVSRGWPRGGKGQWKAPKSLVDNDACPFCDISPDFVLADLEDSFAMPFRLVGDSRPFFSRHMLAIAKKHTGGISFDGFRDLVRLLNTAFSSMKAIIGTGNQADHLHAHIFEAALPIERWGRKPICHDSQVSVSRLTNDLGLTYFRLRSADVDRLAGAAYALMRRIEAQGMMTCVLLSAGTVFVIPQTHKTIGRRFEYLSIFDAFKDPPARPEGLRPRYVGPIEMAGIFLCYSRGDVSAMQQMYDAMDLETYRNILRETGLQWSSDAARRLSQWCRAAFGMRSGIVSTLGPTGPHSGAVGGKAVGVSALHELRNQWNDPAPGMAGTLAGLLAPAVPEGLVVTTSHFEQLVQANPTVQTRLAALCELLERCGPSDGQLDGRLGKQVAATSQSLRRAVAEVPIPDSVVDLLRRSMGALGGNIALRSSADIEDQSTDSGAGLGRTVLDVASRDALLTAVRSVWASMYSDGFVQLCRRTGKSIAEARMAVLLQPMVHPRAAGVVTSQDARGRPVFSISACDGLGVHVVDGGPADSWLVSPDARCILERHCRQPGHACLSDSDVLSLAAVSRRVQLAWQSSGKAEQVDIEFAIDNDGRIVLLQCRPLTALPDRDGTHVDVADVQAIPAGVGVVPLGGLCAFEGVAVGRLNVLRGLDEPALKARIQTGDIIVATRTTCRWNGALEGVAGVIAEEGSTVSHPAIHARERRLPTVIAAQGAMSDLARYQGQTVTFDSGSRKVYQGIVPTVSVARAARWLAADDRGLAPACADRPTSTQTDAGLMTDFEGTWWPRPAIPYSPFQLDYYAKAFRWYARWLRSLDWPGNGPRPPIGRHAVKIRQGILYVGEPQDGPPERRFMRSLSLEDFDFLIERRWELLERLGEFYETLSGLDVDNVEKAASRLVQLLGINSMGYEMRTAFAELHFDPQARYIRPAWLARLMRTAMSERQQTRPDLEVQWRKAWQKLVKDAATSAEAAAALARLDDCAVADGGAEMFRATQPSLYERIARLAEDYKLDSEDLRTGTDPFALLRLLAGRVKAMRASPRDMHPDILSDAGQRDEDPSDIAAWAKSALVDYPTLKTALATARSEEMFRSNFHHLITRYQRKVAAAMLHVAAQHPTIFDRPQEVFEISSEELVALVRDNNPHYIRQTMERSRLLSQADDALHDLWATDPRRAVAAFQQGARAARAILLGQARDARCVTARYYYGQAIRAMSERLGQLMAMARKTVASNNAEVARARKDENDHRTADHHRSERSRESPDCGPGRQGRCT